jgi:hypothetical protein
MLGQLRVDDLGEVVPAASARFTAEIADAAVVSADLFALRCQLSALAKVLILGSDPGGSPPFP